jgi:hypothetical protein
LGSCDTPFVTGFAKLRHRPALRVQHIAALRQKNLGIVSLRWPLNKFDIHWDQQEAFEAMFAQFMYVTLTPLHPLESPELKTALALLGAVPPSCKKVGGPLLHRAYNEAVSKSIARIKECSAVWITMDGWKKRAAEHGTPIITVIILLPDGDAQFWKVRCSPQSSFL